MELRIPTDSLRALLDDKPELRAKLESMACEKIAEEIMRKASSKDVERLMADTLKNVTREASNAMRDPAKWPEDLKRAVMQVVLSHLKDQRVAMIDGFRDELTKMFEEAQLHATASLKKQIEELTLAHREHLRTYARRDFIEILREAQAGVPTHPV